jgi:hypothetical protein
MALADAARDAAASMAAIAAALQRVKSAQGTAADRALAYMVKRGQATELLAALRKALGL